MRAHLVNPADHKVEREARGALLQPDVVIASELRLPVFDRHGDGPLYAWPPQVPSPAQQMAQAMLDHPAAYADHFDWRNWHEEIERRNRRILEDSRRQVEEFERRQREREEREKAEVERAKGADCAAYAERGWPT
jgi:hypothetical protein